MHKEYKPRHKIKKSCRTRNVLQVLKDHGPLTARGISEFTDPYLSSKEVHRVVGRLREQNLIYMRSKNPSDFPACYQILQRSWARKKTAHVLGCDPDDLLQPQHRFPWVYSNLRVARWYTALRNALPNIIVLRRHEIIEQGWMEKLYSTLQKDKKYYPDFMLISEKDHDGKRKIVPIKFADAMLVDYKIHVSTMRAAKNKSISGQVYIGEDYFLEDIYNHIMEYKFQQFLERKRVRTNDFFAFSVMDVPSKRQDLFVCLVNHKLVRIDDWFNALDPVTVL